MTRFNMFAAEGNWEECEALVLRHKGEHSPVNHVLEAGIRSRDVVQLRPEEPVSPAARSVPGSAQW